MVVRANEYILCGGRPLKRGDIIPAQWADRVERRYIMSASVAAHEFGDEPDELAVDVEDERNDDHGGTPDTEVEDESPDPYAPPEPVGETDENDAQVEMVDQDPDRWVEEDPDDDPYDGGTTTKVLQWVGRDPDGEAGNRRPYAIARERERDKPRSGVLSALGAE